MDNYVGFGVVIVLLIVQAILSKQVKFFFLGFIIPILYLLYSIYILVTKDVGILNWLFMLIIGEALLLEIQYTEYNNKKKSEKEKN